MYNVYKLLDMMHRQHSPLMHIFLKLFNHFSQTNCFCFSVNTIVFFRTQQESLQQMLFATIQTKILKSECLKIIVTIKVIIRFNLNTADSTDSYAIIRLYHLDFFKNQQIVVVLCPDNFHLNI